MSNLDLVKELLVQLAFLTPLATALTEVVKAAFKIQSKRFIPLISVVIGAGCGMILLGLTVPAAVVGVIAGLAGTGLWEVGKTTVAGK